MEPVIDSDGIQIERDRFKSHIVAPSKMNKAAREELEGDQGFIHNQNASQLGLNLQKQDGMSDDEPAEAQNPDV
jgi:hypothetical protein